MSTRCGSSLRSITAAATAVERKKKDDIEIFWSMSLSISESVHIAIPRIEGKGKNKKAHIRGGSDNPIQIVQEIREFREMSDRQQRNVEQKWRKFSRAQQVPLSG
jgi:uncharacterized Zn finger protein